MWRNDLWVIFFIQAKDDGQEWGNMSSYYDYLLTLQQVVVVVDNLQASSIFQKLKTNQNNLNTIFQTLLKIINWFTWRLQITEFERVWQVYLLQVTAFYQCISESFHSKTRHWRMKRKGPSWWTQHFGSRSYKSQKPGTQDKISINNSI